jgi:hypothetical protein
LQKEKLQSSYISRIFVFEITIFRQLVPGGHQYCRIPKNFLLSSLTCSQIWLIPLVDYHQYKYITKLEKKKKNPARPNWVLFLVCFWSCNFSFSSNYASNERHHQRPATPERSSSSSPLARHGPVLGT